MADVQHFAGNRRNFLKQMSIGTAGLALGSMAAPKRSDAYLYGGGKSNVSLVASTDIRQATYDALKMIESDVKKGVESKKSVLIKVNMGQVAENVWLNATDVNQTRGIIDFLQTFYDGDIIVGEATAAGNVAEGTMAGFQNYNYMPLLQEYKNVSFRDLNRDDAVTAFILDSNGHPQPIDIISTYLDPDVYVVSPSRLKTHNCVIGTCSYKNIGMGSPINRFWTSSRQGRNQKQLMHSGGNKGLSFNMYRLAELGVRPDLAILDGVVGMEGNGPVNGTPVEGGILVASTDFVAADRIGYELMGIDYDLVLYMQWMSAAGMGNDQIENMNLKGANYKDHVIKYELHRNYETQIQWVLDDREKRNTTDFNR